MRFQRAYHFLVKGFGKTGSRFSPGPEISTGGTKPASFAPKLWRFCGNPHVKETALIEPMHATIRREAAEHPGVLPTAHDWSTLSFGGHDSKSDRAALTHAHDVGYDLATALLMVRGFDGAPIAPAVVSLKAAAVVHSTRDDPHPLDMCHVDQVLGNIKYTYAMKFGSTVVHVIDREADSVNHWRQWSADGHLALVRADDRVVLYQGEEQS